MNQFPPTQAKMIQTWTEKRDSLLREIGIYQTESDNLQKKLKEQGLALDDLQQSIAECFGRLSELENLENRRRDSVATDVAELETRKSRLEAEITAKVSELESFEKKLNLEIIVTKDLQDTHSLMKEQVKTVEKIVGEVSQMSQKHLSETKTALNEVKAVVETVIKKGNENVKQTGIVLEKLPKYIFELQRPIPIQRAPKGAFIGGDTKKK